MHDVRDQAGGCRARRASSPKQLRGGDAESQRGGADATCSRARRAPFRDVALLNAAAAIVVAGKAKDLKEGVAIAAKSVDRREAEGRLDRPRSRVSNADRMTDDG